jgi:hypothetical protein
MPRAEARGGMATGDRGVARRVKAGGFGVVPLGFATDAPGGSAGSFTRIRKWCTKIEDLKNLEA